MVVDLQAVRKYYEALCFQKAAELIESAQEESKEVWMHKVRIYAALSNVKKLEVLLEEGQKKWDILHSKDLALIEAYFHGLLACSKEEQILALMPNVQEKSMQGLRLKYMHMLAFLNTGQVEKAAALAKELVQEESIARPKAKEELRFSINVWVSFGDAQSFLQENEAAMSAYKKAAQLSKELPPENAYSLVRKAMIYNNMADLYEQTLQNEKALAAYKKAIALLENAQQYTFDDQLGYLCSVLDSCGNFLSNLEQFEQAKIYLDQALSWIRKAPEKFVNLAALQAKTDFYLGLWHLYQNDTKQAYECLSKAYVQQEVLVENHLEKKLELARTAYYLAQLVQERSEQVRLLKQAQKEFEKQWEKEPAFYLGVLGEICNDLALKQSDASLAEQEFKKARSWYGKALLWQPEDEELQFSLFVVTLNEIRALFFDDKRKEAITLVKTLSMQIKEEANRHTQSRQDEEALMEMLFDLCSQFHEEELLTDLQKEWTSLYAHWQSETEQNKIH
jgi:tetratricopeptide (TPR) repeat protein